jgi:hypothetical protein
MITRRAETTQDLLLTGCSWVRLHGVTPGEAPCPRRKPPLRWLAARVAGDRPDLLAEVAGIVLGTSEAKGAEYRAPTQPSRSFAVWQAPMRP